jgi:hypothetical protein
MSITDQERERLLNMDRQEMIEYLCHTGYITALPPEQQGVYLFGKTDNHRAICLAWGDQNSGCVTLERVTSAYCEIGAAALNVPFLFFGRTSLCAQSDVFTFAQIPRCFEIQSNPVLRILQGMNLQGNLHVPMVARNQKPQNAIPLIGVRQMNQALRAEFHNHAGKVYCLQNGIIVRVFHAKQPRNGQLQVAGSNGFWFTPDPEGVWVEPPPGVSNG